MLHSFLYSLNAVLYRFQSVLMFLRFARLLSLFILFDSLLQLRVNHNWLKRDDIILDGISVIVDWTMVLELDHWFSTESPSRFLQKDLLSRIAIL